MSTDTILNQLTEGTILEGPHWTEPVKVLTAKARGSRIEVQAVGTHTKRLWTKLLKPEEFDDTIQVTSAGELAALDEVRSLVTNYALAKILKTTHTAAIDPESRFYVVWKWSYGDAKVPADESFKLSQGLGMHTEAMWDRTGVLEKSGENVQTVPISKRTRMKNLGEPTADGTPASLIDVLHRLCAFREKGDTQGMAQFLGQSGQANNPTLWLVAQAISEILPDGDREKQLMQGLLNQREGLAEATQQSALF